VAQDLRSPAVTLECWRALSLSFSDFESFLYLPVATAAEPPDGAGSPRLSLSFRSCDPPAALPPAAAVPREYPFAFAPRCADNPLRFPRSETESAAIAAIAQFR